jgi:hypothetical protein
MNWTPFTLISSSVFLQVLLTSRKRAVVGVYHDFLGGFDNPFYFSSSSRKTERTMIIKKSPHVRSFTLDFRVGHENKEFAKNSGRREASQVTLSCNMGLLTFLSKENNKRCQTLSWNATRITLVFK